MIITYKVIMLTEIPVDYSEWIWNNEISNYNDRDSIVWNDDVLKRPGSDTIHLKETRQPRHIYRVLWVRILVVYNIMFSCNEIWMIFKISTLAITQKNRQWRAI